MKNEKQMSNEVSVEQRQGITSGTWIIYPLVGTMIENPALEEVIPEISIVSTDDIIAIKDRLKHGLPNYTEADEGVFQMFLPDKSNREEYANFVLIKQHYREDIEQTYEEALDRATLFTSVLSLTLRVESVNHACRLSSSINRVHEYQKLVGFDFDKSHLHLGTGPVSRENQVFPAAHIKDIAELKLRLFHPLLKFPELLFVDNVKKSTKDKFASISIAIAKAMVQKTFALKCLFATIALEMLFSNGPGEKAQTVKARLHYLFSDDRNRHYIENHINKLFDARNKFAHQNESVKEDAAFHGINLAIASLIIYAHLSSLILSHREFLQTIDVLRDESLKNSKLHESIVERGIVSTIENVKMQMSKLPRLSPFVYYGWR